MVPPASASAQQADTRMFPQTGYRVVDDAFWSYFTKRGGVRTFGYPVSNPFTLYGFKVQVFQRAVLQLRPDGAVAMTNVLDDGLLPYTTINGSTFPASDPDVIKRQPQVGESDYHQKALQFVRDNAPDEWQGMKVNFFQTFSTSVRADEAFPDGGGNAGLLLGFNLEIWGLPTSKPMADPANAGFVYQRFQRGIMHYDTACRCTQGLLLADYVKSILAVNNLPPDLAAQAQKSPLFGQYDPSNPGWLARPSELASTDLTNAFRSDDVKPQPRYQAMSQTGAAIVTPPSTVSPTPTTPASATPTPTAPSGPKNERGTVFIDPGHGGKEIGASSGDGGQQLIEKDLNLKVATRLAQLLKDAGVSVVQSRTADAQVDTTRDLTGDGKVNLSDDLQARVDAANAAGADVFVAVHFNGMADPTKKGTQTFYSEGRPFSSRSKALAELVQAGITRAVKGAGYETADRGATSDSRVLGQNSHYYVLGPESPIIKRASGMPGIIGEALFLTNPDDAQALRQDKVVEAVARGYADGILAYLKQFPPGK
jgi:N-acetylmuramoyl-L-alanine amidase